MDPPDLIGPRLYALNPKKRHKIFTDVPHFKDDVMAIQHLVDKKNTLGQEFKDALESLSVNAYLQPTQTCFDTWLQLSNAIRRCKDEARHSTIQHPRFKRKIESFVAERDTAHTLRTMIAALACMFTGEDEEAGHTWNVVRARVDEYILSAGEGPLEYETLVRHFYSDGASKVGTGYDSRMMAELQRRRIGDESIMRSKGYALPDTTDEGRR